MLEYKAGFEEFHVFRYSVKPGTSVIDLKPLKFHTFSVCIIISGHGTVHMREFSHEEKLNKFKVEANCAYYIMPDQEFLVQNDSESELVLFLAKPDIWLTFKNIIYQLTSSWKHSNIRSPWAFSSSLILSSCLSSLYSMVPDTSWEESFGWNMWAHRSNTVFLSSSTC